MTHLFSQKCVYKSMIYKINNKLVYLYLEYNRPRYHYWNFIKPYIENKSYDLFSIFKVLIQ